ncbi:hypothetical protein WME79_11685 [Sorangium sp. So ce726]|uniref:hypothetical protein n=1 Tax=Sorangium sp. So ce726 TaxID=3133319 RepID=UPI003F5EFA0C
MVTSDTGKPVVSELEGDGTLPAARPIGQDVQPSKVVLQRTANDRTDDQALWVLIRYSSQAIAFEPYAYFMEQVMTGAINGSANKAEQVTSTSRKIDNRRHGLPFPGVDAYALLKASTEVFLMASVGINPVTDAFERKQSVLELMATMDPERMARLGDTWSAQDLTNAWANYSSDWNGEKILPYLDVIRQRLGVPTTYQVPRGYEEMPYMSSGDCFEVLQQKLIKPTMIELIWSYWHEEAMLAQTLSAISMRFQNRRMGARDPLANMEVDPLRPLNSFLWGWVQDEQHRLSVARRAYEYEHHYGFGLHGKAIPPVRSADSRSKFLEAFHNLLFHCMKFYNEDDDTTRIADGFPVLNSLKEVHILLTEGGHNQYGDLPWNARLEMLMMQWILARPEMREFIGGRPMVAYPEPWMDRVDTMKTLQGWTNTNVMHFRDLGVFGEQILLSTRFGNWNSVIQPQQAANWARYWRAEVQGYIHAYRAVTGVDLTAVPTDGHNSGLRFMPPSHHLRARLAEQQRGRMLPR